MRTFKGAGDRFLQEMSTIRGTRFRGTIMPARDTEGSMFDFSNPRVILRTRTGTPLQAADVVNAPSGVQYVVGDYFSADADFISWRIFLVEKVMAWKSFDSVTDTLTGLKKTDGLIDRGVAYCSVDMDRRQFVDPGVKLPIERLTIVTNQPVKENDTLDGKRVTRSNHQLGLWVVEIHD